MTPKQLEKAALDLSNFEGFEGYTGMDDDFVSFGGAVKSFLQKQSGNNRTFTMNIENKGDEDHRIVMFPAYTSEGREAGAIVITDGTVETGEGAEKNLVVSGSPKKVQNFLDFIFNNPTACIGFKVKCKVDSAQLDQGIEVRTLSPFRTLESEIIDLASYQDENTYRDKVVTIPRAINLGNQVELSMVLMAGEKVTITWFCGAIVNTNAALAAKQRKAEVTSTQLHLLASKRG